MARRGLITAIACAMAFGFSATSAGAQVSLETSVKAAYLYKLAPFVEWPPEAFEGPSAPLAICVTGRDPFGAVLDQLVAGQRVGSRAIVVRRTGPADAKAGCQILYAGGPTARVREVLKAVRGAPILTVTDDPASPGMIDFVLSENRVRFRIDDAAAAAAGLVISSKLLSLAVSVTPRERPR